MAQRIVVDCDLHGARDELAAGREYDIAVRAQGEAFSFLTVDLCDECVKPLADMLGELSEAGRLFDDVVATELRNAVGSPSKRKAVPSLQARRVGTPSPARSAPVESGDFVCPGCGSVLRSKSGLNSHVQTEHPDSTIEQLRGEPTPYQCPDCPRAFSRAQSLGVHRARKHGHTAQGAVRAGE